MTHQDEAAATDRLRQALSAFQTAQNHLLSAERRLKGLPQGEVDAFWKGLGRRLEANMRATGCVAPFSIPLHIFRGTAKAIKWPLQCSIPNVAAEEADCAPSPSCPATPPADPI